MKVVIKEARIAFPKIWEPEKFQGQGTPACSANFIIDPRTQKAEVDKVLAAMWQAAQDKWKDRAADIYKMLKAKSDICLRPGDEKADKTGYASNVFVSARNKARPIILDRQKNPLTQADGVIYAGCYVNVSLDIWAQDNASGKRINATLLAIQFMRDGEAFSGGEAYSDDDFSDEGCWTDDPLADNNDFF